jgi:glycosyltransferase involved in cell wall biosynthesis
MHQVPMGDYWFPDIPLLKKYAAKKIKEQAPSAYKLNDLIAEISLYVQCIFNRVDVVHYIDAEHSLGFLPRWLKKRRFPRSRNTPKIVAMFHQPPALLEQLIDIEVVGQVDRVLVVSPTQADYFSRYIPREQITVILLGIDTEHFKPFPTPAKNSSVEKNPGKLKCLGGGVWLRDYDSLLKTAEMMRAIPGIEFHLVSPGIDPMQRTRWENVIYHDAIPDAELLDLYHGCDVLFLPLQDATANTFLLEGSACGLPLVTTALDSTRAYFPGEEAILIQDNDPAAFAGALTDLLRDPGKRLRMAEAARRRALQLSWENIVKQYEKLYEELSA